MSEQPPPPSPLPPPPPPQPSDTHLNGGASAPPDTVAPKRHRRPSVRLGDIGDQHTYDNTRRTKQNQWKFASKESKSSKTRPLVNLTGGFQDFGQDDSKDCRDDISNNNNINIINGGSSGGNDNINGVIGSWKGRDCSKSKRGFSGSKRVRTNWGDEFGQDDDESLNFEMDDEMELNYRGKEARVRVSDGIELDGPSDNNNNNNNNNCLERDGVRVWLNQLGLGRYAPVFEVHEVDDEVLPLLTLEDLKDMGINAVGSRRKMFCSIQKLGKGFS